MALKTYVRTSIVMAEPAPSPAEDKMGRPLKQEPGYRVIYDDDYVSWCPKAKFEEKAREISPDEVIMMVGAEPSGL